MNKLITLKEFADRTWRAMYGDKTYEQVEQEQEERRATDADKILANLPYKKSEE